MLFGTKIARPDNGTAISYLATRVRYPYQRNLLNMVHVFNYIRGAKYIPLILSADSSGMLKCYIDGSYALHPNMREHTGGRLAMGRGLQISASRKKKLNTRISTES